MATLAARLTLLAQRVATELKAHVPRLLPSGGVANAYLGKSSATDYAVAWMRPRVRVVFPITGQPVAGEIIGPFVVDQAFTIPAGFANSQASGDAAAAATAVFTVMRNNASIGTITFASGSMTGAFAMATNADVQINSTDRITISCPATQDTGLKNVGLTIVGFL